MQQLRLFAASKRLGSLLWVTVLAMQMPTQAAPVQLTYPVIHNDARTRFGHSNFISGGVTTVTNDGENAINYQSDAGAFPSFAYANAGSYAPVVGSVPPGLTPLFGAGGRVNPFAAAETSARGSLSQSLDGLPSTTPVYAMADAQTTYSFSIAGPGDHVDILAHILLFVGITYESGAAAGTTSGSATFRLRDASGTVMQSRTECNTGVAGDCTDGGVATILTGTLLTNHDYEAVLDASATSLNFWSDSQHFSHLFSGDTSAVSYADPFFEVDPNFADPSLYTFRFSQQANNIPPQPVPEPASIWMALTALAGVVVSRRARAGDLWSARLNAFRSAWSLFPFHPPGVWHFTAWGGRTQKSARP